MKTFGKAFGVAALLLTGACQVNVDNDLEAALDNQAEAIENAAEDAGNRMEEAGASIDNSMDTLANDVDGLDVDIDFKRDGAATNTQ